MLKLPTTLSPTAYWEVYTKLYDSQRFTFLHSNILLLFKKHYFWNVIRSICCNEKTLFFTFFSFRIRDSRQVRPVYYKYKGSFGTHLINPSTNRRQQQ